MIVHWLPQHALHVSTFRIDRLGGRKIHFVLMRRACAFLGIWRCLKQIKVKIEGQMSAPCNDPAILSSVLRSAVKETGKTEILDRANLSNQKREPLMKYASLTRAICLAAILFVAGCNGQVIESPITTQSGLAFMSSKRISAGDLSNQDASLSERSEENAASDPVQPEAMDDCPVNRLENLDIEGI